MSPSSINQNKTQHQQRALWIAFVLAYAATLTGILLLSVPPATKVLLGMGFVFTVSAGFPLARQVGKQGTSGGGQK